MRMCMLFYQLIAPPPVDKMNTNKYSSFPFYLQEERH